MGHRCCSKQKIKRGLWSPEEDEKLVKYITTHGHKSWSSVPKFAGLQRCGKSCRLRWINYLRPDLKRGSFTAEEEQIIIDIHRILGNRWAQIAKHLPGRTDNEVKNFWNSCIKKKLISQGLDPQTHNLLASHRRTSSANYTISNTNNIHQNSNSIFTLSTSSHTPIISNAPIIETSQTFSSSSSLPNKSQQQTNVGIVNSSEYHHNNKFFDFTYEPSSIENNNNGPNIICSASCMNPYGVGVLWDSRVDDCEDFGVQRLGEEEEEEEEGAIQALQVQQQLEKEKNCEKGTIIDEMREATNNNYDKGNDLETNCSTLESSNNFDFGLLESVLNSEFMSHDGINYMDELAAWNF